MIYFDSTYIAKLYLKEPDSDAVRARVALEGEVCSAVLAQLEVASVFHRKLREKLATPDEFRRLMDQFDSDCADGLWTWLPVTSAVLQSVVAKYRQLPADTFLRAADAVHLATAAEAELTTIFSNDRHLLAAAPHFGLTGSVIS